MERDEIKDILFEEAISMNEVYSYFCLSYNGQEIERRIWERIGEKGKKKELYSEESIEAFSTAVKELCKRLEDLLAKVKKYMEENPNDTNFLPYGQRLIKKWEENKSTFSSSEVRKVCKWLRRLNDLLVAPKTYWGRIERTKTKVITQLDEMHNEFYDILLRVLEASRGW